MSLPVLIKLPDSLIEESQYFTTVTLNPNRSTIGVAGYTNPRTLATYSVPSGGQEALALYMYETNPALKNYIFSDTVYAEIKSNIETAQTDIANLETDVDIINTAVSDTGLVNAMVVNTAGTFDMAKNGNITPFIIPLFTNTGTATLSMDGGAVTGIRKADDTGTLVVLEAGDIKKNVPTQFVLDTVSGFFVYAPKGGSNIKSIQRGTTVITNSDTNVTISNVNLNNCLVKIKFARASTYISGQAIYFLTSAELTSATNLLLKKGITDAGIALTVDWEIVEYNNVKSKQTGTTNVTVQTINTTISSINLAKSILEFSFYTNSTSSGISSALIAGKLSTSTNINFNHSQDSSFIYYVKWQVLEFN